MNNMSHKQAIKLIHLRLDGLLNESQSRSLKEHLDSCDTCRTYAAEMEILPAHLQKEFHIHWDQESGPSYKVLEQVTAKARRIPMMNRISSSTRLLAGVAILALLALGTNFVISQMQSNPVDAIGTESVSGSSQSDSGLIAFTSEKNGNLDIYTMHADGSGLTNLTNNPAHDVNPFWSPDGKHIAFMSDRAGFMGIFVMNADGSGVIQLTEDESDHEFGSNYGSGYSPWSPDGSRLMVSQISQEQEKSMLYSIDINAKDKLPLVNEPNMYHAISWSPDGQHIAFIANDPQNPNVLRLYIVNADGSNRRDITKSLQANERLDNFSYDWSTDGQSIFFIVYKHISEGNDRWIAYEAGVDGETLIERATSSTPMDSWRDGTSFVTGFDSSLLTWLRSDGTYSTLKPLENCHTAHDSYYGFVARRSFNGNFIIGVDCPNDDLWFYWANSDGTYIKQLFDSPMPVKDGGLNDIVWSPDSKYIAVNVYSAGATYTYVVNVEESLKDSSALPDPIGRGAIGYSVSWQPIVETNIVEEKPTPEPTRTSFHNGLIAFVSERDGNSEIYVMKVDGSNQVNLTNNLAADDSPVWSPDGERLAFVSNRTGSPQIYAMNPDGSNLIQITDNPDTESWSDLDWSSDGRYLAASHTPIESKRTYPDRGRINIYLINADGSGITQLTENEAGVDHSPNWSPNGDLIAFIRFEFNLTQIYAIRPDATGMVNLSKSARNDFTFDWSPDSSRIMYFSSPTRCFTNDCPVNELRTVQVDGVNRKTLLMLTDPLLFDVERMRWSPDGTRLFIVTLDFDGLAHFYIVSNDGSNLTRLGDSSAINNMPGRIPQARWSPDGLFIISDSDKAGNKDIYTFNVNEVLHTTDTEPLKLTYSAADDYSPAWQPKP